MPKQDGLWVELMKALYTDEFGETKHERLRKPYWLGRFRDDGCYLIDAVKEPFATGTSDRVRIQHIREQAEHSVEEARGLIPDGILLVKATVWRGLHAACELAGLPILNHGPLPFPGSGQQKRFREAFDRDGVREFVRG